MKKIFSFITVLVLIALSVDVDAQNETCVRGSDSAFANNTEVKNFVKQVRPLLPPIFRNVSTIRSFCYNKADGNITNYKFDGDVNLSCPPKPNGASKCTQDLIKCRVNGTVSIDSDKGPQSGAINFQKL